MANIRSLGELGLVDAPSERPYDNLTKLASQLLNVPAALVVLVEPHRNRQYFKSMCGLPEPWASRRQTPLSHSICQHVRAMDAPLAISDTRDVPLVRDSLAIHELGVIAYLGVPIHGPDGSALGALCVIDYEPRDWSADDVETMERLGTSVSDLIRMAALRLDALDAAEARLRFLAEMSHEIRTPLNGVVGGVDLLCSLLAELPGGGRARDVAGLVDASAETVLRLLDDALDLAIVDAGGLELREEEVRPLTLARQVAALHGAGAERRGVTVEVVSTGTFGAATRQGDAARLVQILGNVVGNAVKFTRRGRVVVRVGGTERLLELEVDDSGPGMDAATLARVFEPFRQGGTGAVRGQKGSGLGLAIVDRIVRAMNGAVEMESQPGKGTRVRLSLPLPVSDASDSNGAVDDSSADARRAALPGAETFAGVRVLVADDIDTSRVILSLMLQRFGAEVVAVSDGPAALSACSRDRFDLLLLDLQMPGLTGLDVISELREGGHDMPALAVTADGFPDQIRACLAAGFNGHLLKPVRQADLAMHLMRVLDLSQPSRS
ncbi:MAG: ATP-binding protein [Pseudomonadota bacterium]